MKSGFPTSHRYMRQVFPIIGYGILALVILLFSSTPALANVSQTGGGGSTVGITISSPNPASGPAGTKVVVSGSNWVPGTTVSVSIGTTNGTCDSTTPVNGATATVNDTGSVQIAFAWPSQPTGKYTLCGFGTGASSNGVPSDNTFEALSTSSPSIILPNSAVGGGSVAITGSNWYPTGTQVEVLYGAQGSQGCDNQLAVLTSQSNGVVQGTFTAPNVTTATTITVAAISPQGSCSTAQGPTLRVVASLPLSPGPSGVGATPTNTAITSPTATPTLGSGGGVGTITPGTGTPGSGTVTPGSGTGTPNAGKLTVTPTKTKGGSGTGGTGSGGGNSGSGFCPPLPKSFCQSGGIPWWVLCLILLLLLALLLWLFVILARRRNDEVNVQEDEITYQIDPATVQPIENMRLSRIVRVTTQFINRNTGEVRRTNVRVYEEWIDAAGNVKRRWRN